MTALASLHAPRLDDEQARTLLAAVRSPRLPDDLVQDVMLDLVRMHRKGVPFGELIGLAKTVVTRKRYWHLRRRYREEARRRRLGRFRHAPASACPVAAVDARLDAEAAMARIPASHRGAVLRVYRDGESQAAAAGEFGCSRDRVRAALAEAKALLSAG